MDPVARALRALSLAGGRLYADAVSAAALDVVHAAQPPLCTAVLRKLVPYVPAAAGVFTGAAQRALLRAFLSATRGAAECGEQGGKHVSRQDLAALRRTLALALASV